MFPLDVLRVCTPGKGSSRNVTIGVLLVIVLLLEETNYGILFNKYMNHYTEEVVFPITRLRKEKVSISIAILVKDDKNADQYALARSTVRCYAEIHGYVLREVDISKEKRVANWCPNHTDFMFLRHCVLSHLLAEWKEEWVLFVDADMAVINPNHLIEDYLPDRQSNTSIVFYDRIMNHEIMAGSYFLRNIEYSRLFLLFWSQYEFRLPNSFHGSDNGAIHSVYLEWALPQLHRERARCETIWRTSTEYSSLYEYEACTRSIMAKGNVTAIRILPKGRWAWCRDGWLTNSMWSGSDFMLHGWQKKRRDVLGFGRWHSPLVDGTWKGKCNAHNGHLLWRYKDSFITSDSKTSRMIKSVILELDIRYNHTLESLRSSGIVTW